MFKKLGLMVVILMLVCGNSFAGVEFDTRRNPVFNAEAILTGVTATSDSVKISGVVSGALHLNAITGTTPDVTFTYAVCSTKDGTYIVPSASSAITTSASTTDIVPFSIEPAEYIKIIAKNNGANTATVTAQLLSNVGTPPKNIEFASGTILDVDIESLSSIGLITNAAIGTSAEQITVTSTACKRAIVFTNPANTGYMTIGDSSVTSGNGIVLYAADGYQFDIDDVDILYAISSVNGEDITVIYLK